MLFAQHTRTWYSPNQVLGKDLGPNPRLDFFCQIFTQVFTQVLK